MIERVEIDCTPHGGGRDALYCFRRWKSDNNLPYRTPIKHLCFIVYSKEQADAVSMFGVDLAGYAFASEWSVLIRELPHDTVEMEVTE